MKNLILAAALLAQAPLLHAFEMTGPGMLHGDIAIGGMLVSGADLKRDYQTSTNKPDFGDVFSLMVSAQGGYLSSFGFYTDLGLDVGPLRTITSKKSTTIFGLPYTVDEKLEFTQYRLLLIPGFLFPMGKLLLSAQAGLGYSMVNGVYTNTTTFGGSSTGGYTLTGSGFDYVPELRAQYLFSPRMSAGLAIGWNGSKYSSINVGSFTGAYSGSTASNPVKTADGSGNMTIDHTGVFAKLVITTYLKDFFPNAGASEVSRPQSDLAPSAAPAASAPAPEAAAAPAPAPAAAPEDFGAAMNSGSASYKAGDFASAEASYLKATAANPQSAKAWQALGNARAQQKNRAGALEAYDKSLAIEPANSALKAYVDSLRK